MNRRGFIGTLLASFGALAIPQSPLWMPPKVAESLPLLQPTSILTLQQIAKETLRRIANEAPYRLTLVRGDAKIGTSVEGVTLTDQFSLESDMPIEIAQFGLDPERYIAPCAHLLTKELHKRKALGCGELQLPVGLPAVARVSHADSGLSLRAIQHWRHKDGYSLSAPIFQYSPDELVPIIRFDMLVAA